jgi:hypothetical protein
MEAEVAYLRVVVDHDGLLAKRFEGTGSINGAPIKLDRASNTIHTAT